MTVTDRGARLLRRVRARLSVQLHRWRGKRIAHFLHIGKTGGTAIKSVLSDWPATGRYGIIVHTHGVTLKDIPPGDGVFFFLRNPISRFVSGFYSRQRQGRPAYYSPWTAAEERAFTAFKTPNELALALMDSEDTRRDRAQDAMKAIRHVRDSYWNWLHSEDYLMARADDILLIGHQESLDDDFEKLKALLGLPRSTVLPTDHAAAHRNPTHLDRSLEPTAVANLRKWYQRDFELLDLIKSRSVGRPSLARDGTSSKTQGSC